MVNNVRHLLLLLILFLSAPAFATDYYVASDGSGANCTSGDPCAIATAQTASSAGDTIYFDNTDTWTATGGTYWLSAKGGVLYDGETWGGGTRATVTLTGNYTSVLYIGADHATYTTEIKGFKVNINSNQSSGANINWPASNDLTGALKRIADCEIYGMTGSAVVYGAKMGAIGGDSVVNAEYDNLNIHDMNTTAIAIYPAVNCETCLVDQVTVSNCTIGPNIDGGAFAGAGSGIIIKGNVHNIVVQNNTITDAVTNNLLIQDDGTQGGCTSTGHFRYNTIYAANGDSGIETQCSSSYPLENVWIYGNTVYNNPKSGIDFVNNNGPGSTVHVINNSLYNNGSAGTYHEISIDSSGSYTVLDVRNNVVYSNQGDVCINDAAGDITAHSNNLVYRASGTAVNIGGTTYTSAEVTNWEATGLGGDPLYTSASDFTLQSESPAINSGVPLTVTDGASSGYNITVADAGGFVEPLNNRAGDTIQLIGDETTATIVSINYSTNVITVDTSLEWESGVGVTLTYSGTTVDRGAEEYETEAEPEAPAATGSITAGSGTISAGSGSIAAQ